MKKTATLLLSAFLLSFAAYAQTEGFSLKDFNLHGKVKSVSEVTYLGVSKFGDLTKGQKVNESEEKFSKNGLALEREYISYDDEGKKDDGFDQSYTYDKNNFLIGLKEEEDDELVQYKMTNNASGKIEVLDAYTKKGQLTLRQKYKYNAAGKETEVAEYNGDGDLVRKLLYTYSSTGDRKEEKIVDQTGRALELNISVYDNKGNVIESNRIEYKGQSKLEYIRKYKYNQNNQKIEERNSISGLDKKEIFLYDDKGNLVKTVDPYGSVEVNTYTYDSQGNWIKKVSEQNNAFLGEKVEITERKIAYY